MGYNIPNIGSQLNRQHPLYHKLAAYYPFLEGGGTIARNFIGKREVDNVNFVASRFPLWSRKRDKTALAFDQNVNQAAIMYNSGIFFPNGDSKAFTGSIIMTAPVQFANSQYVMDCLTNGNGGFRLKVNFNWNVSIDFLITGQGNRVATFVIPSDSLPHTVTFTFDGALIKIFCDGIFQSSTVSGVGSIDARAGALVFGANTPVNAQWYTGHISNFMVWSRVLTDQEIMTVHSQPYILFNSSSKIYKPASAINTTNFFQFM